jgi:hypothetical protein
MAENNSTDSARRVNDDLPLIMPGCLYSRGQVVRKFRISETTFDRWVRSGLNVRYRGGKEGVVNGTDVIAFWMSDEPLAPPYRSPYAEKNAARNKKGE